MLTIVPIFQKEAFAFITRFHRHHKKPVGSIFQVAVMDTDKKIDVVAPGYIFSCVRVYYSNNQLNEFKKHLINERFKIVGVAVVGRPNGRKQQDGFTCEVTRLCTDGTQNVCSMLYSAAWRVAKNIGYKKLFTYTLMSESGISLKASGWILDAENVGGVEWNSSGDIIRTNIITDLLGIITTKYPSELKRRWLKQII